jgi:hypothetical protein
MSKNISEDVRIYLSELAPLTVVTLDRLYEMADDEEKRAAVRTALYRHAIGTPVAERHTPSSYYAIRLPIQYSEHHPEEEIFLSLPGIPREQILLDTPSNQAIEEIILRLKNKYGPETMDYWGDAAQYRTVDQARPAMRRARKRDRTCCLCQVADEFRRKVGLPPLGSRRVRASHIVSRKAIFWTIVDKIDREGYSVFSDEGVIRLKESLMAEPLHSDERFIILLCNEHDKLLLASLRSEAI